MGFAIEDTVNPGPLYMSFWKFSQPTSSFDLNLKPVWRMVWLQITREHSLSPPKTQINLDSGEFSLVSLWGIFIFFTVYFYWRSNPSGARLNVLYLWSDFPFYIIAWSSGFVSRMTVNVGSSCAFSNSIFCNNGNIQQPVATFEMWPMRQRNLILNFTWF